MSRHHILFDEDDPGDAEIVATIAALLIAFALCVWVCSCAAVTRPVPSWGVPVPDLASCGNGLRPLSRPLPSWGVPYPDPSSCGNGLRPLSRPLPSPVPAGLACSPAHRSAADPSNQVTAATGRATDHLTNPTIKDHHHVS